jgi:hypothetical protein
MIDVPTLEYLEAEAKLRSLRDATEAKLDAFDEVALVTKLTDKQDEIREGLKGERETFVLCLGLISEAIDRQDRAEWLRKRDAGELDPQRPYFSHREHPKAEVPGLHADRYVANDTERAQLARSVDLTTWIARQHGEAPEWHEYNKLKE